MMRRPPIPGLVMADGWLQPYSRQIRDRQRLFDLKMKRIHQRAGSLEEYARGYRYYGFNRDAETGAWTYREWAPAARRVSLIGDFNGWNRVKVHVVGADGTGKDRIPAWITRAVQDPSTYDFAGEIWMPEHPYEWWNNGFDPSRVEVPFVYEAHVGMGGE